MYNIYYYNKLSSSNTTGAEWTYASNSCVQRDSIASNTNLIFAALIAQ